LTKLAVVSSTQMARLLRHLGFELVRQKGSHAYYRHLDGRATVLPVHRGEDLGRGLIRAILRDIEISPADFERLRKEA
jgi:predicted RNA binding protein YcfA (HicA-like mRNA interferase family)